MNRYQGIMLLTDLDGTLLRDDKTPSPTDLDAIAYFQAHGGRFSVASGRTPLGMLDLLELLSPNALVGCLNGGGVYDCTSRKTLHAVTVPHEALSFAAFADRYFPEVGIEVFTPERVLFCKQNEFTEKHRTDEHLPFDTASYREIAEPITKLLFAAEPSTVDRFAEAVAALPDAKRFNLIRSDHTYFEILMQGIDKSRSVRLICEHAGIGLDSTVTVGDNDNDAPMLAVAGRSYAVSNASAAAKQAAKCVLPYSNMQDPLSKIIESL